MLILIPAYRPDASLVQLARELDTQAIKTGATLHLLVVDDGSGSDYRPIFEQVAGLVPVGSSLSVGQQPKSSGMRAVTVLHLPSNGGKGAALRAGLAWAQDYLPGEVVVTADADGQHLAEDIMAVGQVTKQCARQNAPRLVLGVRTLSGSTELGYDVPLRSRVGNALTAFLFRLSTGKKLADTQTGLRGITPQMIPWALALPGNRYEYEFTMLLRATRHGVGLVQVPVTRVYEEANPTSHFQPVRDSLRIYAPLLAFFAASFSSFVVDTLALLLLVNAGLAVVPAVVVARILSALGNFALNRVMMHDGGPRPTAQRSLGRYALLALVILVLNGAAMEALTRVGLSLVVAKIMVEGTLVPLSFVVQRRWVFAQTRPGGEPASKSGSGTGEMCIDGGAGSDIRPFEAEPEILSPNSSGTVRQTSVVM